MLATRSKTYDVNLLVEEDANVAISQGALPAEENIFITESDDSFIEALAEDGDPDALICQQFEDAISEVLQNDSETASCFVTYHEARKRLVDRNKNRGFWVPNTNQFPKGKGKGKGKQGGKNRRPLAERILQSDCRRCGQRGHWKAECPLRFNNSGAAANSGATVPKESSAFAATSLTMDTTQPSESDMIPMEAFDSHLVPLPYHMDHGENPEELMIFMAMTKTNIQVVNPAAQFRALSHRLVPLIRRRLQPNDDPQLEPPAQVSEMSPKINFSETICFASHGSFGIVDLGASQTIIGENQLSQVLASFPRPVQQAIREIPCDVMFRFGNSSTVHFTKIFQHHRSEGD